MLQPFINIYVFVICSLQFSPLYLVSLVVILVGFIAFNVVPTPTASSSSSSIALMQETSVRVTADDEEGEDKTSCWSHRQGDIGAVVFSTKM